jgi:cytochrome c-type biogenesis protein CcmH
MASLRSLLLAVLLAFVPLAYAGEAAPAADDPALEKRVNLLAETLRCLVCQNQTIADSHADLAVDLKNQIREKLRQGMTEKQIVDFMVQRYGDFVLYNPPVKSTTWLLWFGPFVLLVVGLAVLFLKLRQRSLQVCDAPLSAAEHARAQALLDGQDRREQP